MAMTPQQRRNAALKAAATKRRNAANARAAAGGWTPPPRPTPPPPPRPNPWTPPPPPPPPNPWAAPPRPAAPTPPPGRAFATAKPTLEDARANVVLALEELYGLLPETPELRDAFEKYQKVLTLAMGSSQQHEAATALRMAAIHLIRLTF